MTGAGARVSAVRTERTGRVVWVDVVRLLATFQMVQGHSIDAVLDATLRRGDAFDRWSWARGLTSIAFLFAAGVSFHIATLARIEAHLASPAAIRRRVRRGLLLVVIGYALHNPFGAFGADFETVAAALRDFAIVDVLQCIGVSILVLEGLTLALRDERRVVRAALLLAILCIATSPLTALVDPSGGARPLLAYLTGSGGSIFPFFPWAGYLFAGVAVGSLATRPGTARARSGALLLAVGAAVALLAWGLSRSSFHPYPEASPSPWPGVLKLGVVVLVSGVVALATARVARLPRALESLAGETLVVYVFHVVLLYGAGFGLADAIGPVLPLPRALAVALGVLAVSVVVGLAWPRLRNDVRTVWRRWSVLARSRKAG